MADLTAGNGSTLSYGAGKFGQALSGGFATTGALQLAGTGWTIEAWISAPVTSSGAFAAMGNTDSVWFGTLNGSVFAAIGTYQNGQITLTGGALSGGIGVFHHVAVTAGPAGLALYLDGVLQQSSSTALAATNPGYTHGITLRNFDNWAAPWNGAVDEAAVWTGVRYAGGFTPATVAYAGTEPNLAALWHLDGSGVDSKGVAVPAITVAPNDPALLYSPGNWQVLAGAATAWNPGAYVRTLFSGVSCSLSFDVSNNGAPLSQIWWRIDNGPWTLTPVATTVVCGIPAGTAGSQTVPYHLLEVVFKSMDSDAGVLLNRWNTPAATAIVFKGLTLASGGVVAAPVRAPFNVLVFGDSITEGVRTVKQADGANTPDSNDAMMGWAYALGRLLGAEIGVIGFGGTGYTKSYANVPAFTSSYAALAAGVARSWTPQPDLIVLNHGFNDGANAAISAQGIAVVNGLLAACPAAVIALLNPFALPNQAWMQATATGCSAPERVRFIPTAGFQQASLGLDTVGVHPGGANSMAVIGPRVAAALRPLLSVTTSRWTHA